MSRDADLEIGDHDQARGLTRNSGCIADPPDVARVRLTAPACQEFDGVADDSVNPQLREMLDRPFGVFRDAVQDCRVQCGRTRGGAERSRDVHCVGEEQTVGCIACRSIDPSGDPHGVSKVHASPPAVRLEP